MTITTGVAVEEPAGWWETLMCVVFTSSYEVGMAMGSGAGIMVFGNCTGMDIDTRIRREKLKVLYDLLWLVTGSF